MTDAVRRHERLEGWEGRYQAVLDRAAREPYVLGSHDCFRVACAVLEALTGVDRWPEFAGRYRTRRESLALLAEYGSSFDAAMSWFFGGEPSPALLARRGDVVKALEEDGTPHLGICIGREIVVLIETGLARYPLSTAVCCWRIG